MRYLRGKLVKRDMCSWNCLNFGIGNGSDCVCGKQCKTEIEAGTESNVFIDTARYLGLKKKLNRPLAPP